MFNKIVRGWELASVSEELRSNPSKPEQAITSAPDSEMPIGIQGS